MKLTVGGRLKDWAIFFGGAVRNPGDKSPGRGFDAGNGERIANAGLPDFAILALSTSGNHWKITACLPSDNPWGLMNIIYYSPLSITLILTGAFAAVGVAMGFFIDINKFSLHGAYRDRLIRAYLGASRRDSERRPNPFTGFDENDNIQMHELRDILVQPEALSNLEVFVQRLVERRDAVSRFVYKRLSSDTQALLQDKASEDKLRSALSDDLNRLIQEGDLRREPKFKNIKIENIMTPVPGELSPARPGLTSLCLCSVFRDSGNAS
jgi:hypothetical protein